MASDDWKGKESDAQVHGVLSDDASNSSSGDSRAFVKSGLNESEFYRPIDSYEGRHRYDPSFEWTAKEEKKLVRKVRHCSGKLKCRV
jgi:hypothetical protein